MYFTAWESVLLHLPEERVTMGMSQANRPQVQRRINRPQEVIL